MINKYLEILEEKHSDFKNAEKNFHSWVDKLETLLEHQKNLEKARVLIQKASQITQKQLSIQLSNIVTMALAAVFKEEAYQFKAEFINRRNVTECDLLFVRNGKTRSPLDSCGYGAADIASLALRVAFWKLDDARPVLILDEPTRALSINYQERASMMIKKLSEMGIQFIIVTHRLELAEAADKIFWVNMENEISTVKEIKYEEISNELLQN